MNSTLQNIHCDCGAQIPVLTSYKGRSIKCFQCGTEHAVVHLASPTRQTKCPFCAEEVHPKAIKCLHCKEYFASPDKMQRSARPRMQMQDNGGANILVMGILSFVLCGILGPIAWIQGNRYERECRARGVAPSSSASAGRVLGIVSSVLLIFQFLIMALWLIAMGASGA